MEMTRGAGSTLSVALLLCFSLGTGEHAAAQSATRVSVASGDVQATAASDDPALSADGRVVAFWSRASNLVAGDTNATADVFVHDLNTRLTTRVSVSSAGVQGNGDSTLPSLSADGRFVTFVSNASNLVSSDTNSAVDVFVHDRTTAQTTRISVSSGGGQTAGAARDTAAISGDGRFVAFWSDAADLVAGDTNGVSDVFLHDRSLAQTTRVSAAAGGVQANDRSYRASLSRDGRYVVFLSTARNLAPGGDGGLTPDVFVLDRSTGQFSRVGVPLESRTGGVIADIGPSAISDDGRVVTFATALTDTVGSVSATDPVTLSVFAHDLLVQQTQVIATRVLREADLAFGRPSISGSGALVAFAAADASCSGPAACPRRIFLYDRLTGGAVRVDIPSAGSPDDGRSSGAVALAGSGDRLAFASDSVVLTATSQDTNQARDVFVTDTNVDTDGDGISDAIERTFGLNPNVADSSADPDGDGRTNLQEVRAGTHPRGFVTRYLAEGATSAFFSTSIALVNPSDTIHAAVLLRFLTGTGAAASRTVQVPPRGRRTVDVKTVPGLSTAEFSTVIESDTLVVVDRTMRWDATGYGSHAETAVTAPATTWYFAEGATHSGFGLFYLVQNPGAEAAAVEVTYLRPPPAAPLVKTYVVAPQSRLNVWVNNEAVIDPVLSGLASTDLSAVVRSLNGQPIIVERAMYLNAGGLTFGAGHESAGVTTPATRWFFAEGATGAYFDLFLLIANPNEQPARVRATYLLPSGETLQKTYLVAARSRFNIWVDMERFPDDSGVARLADTAVSTTLESIDGPPIIVERAMWWPGPTSATWQEAHNSPGATQTGVRWALADGEVGGASQTETYLLVANTSASAGSARVTLLFEDGTQVTRTFDLQANSRFNVDVSAEFPAARGRTFGSLVESVGASPVEIVVERAMYSNARGVRWAAGTNALATR
ncbi:MAG: PD40 domain-containing protein, partial [Acidobacteria bacterium]|nr:PD40 domain-containing protein [Acidobacteriota bacterium]